MYTPPVSGRRPASTIQLYKPFTSATGGMALLHLAERQSLSRKLPLLISGLLVTVIVLFAFIAYHQIADALMATTSARMSGTAKLLAGALDESARRVVLEAEGAARDTAVQRYVVANDVALRPAALVALGRRAVTTPQIIGAELLDRSGKRLLWIDGPATDSVPAIRGGRSDSAVRSRSTAIGPFVTEHGVISYDVAAPIVLNSRDTAAYLVQYREVPAGQGAALISGLISAKAVVLFGNRQGGFWTDFSSTVQEGPPPVDGDQHTGHYNASYTARDGVAWTGTVARVGLAPWQVWTGVPVSTALAPAQAFLREIMLAAAMLVLIGGLAAFVLGRQVIAPLREVTIAAEGIAAGDYSRRVKTSRKDEIGILAASFNSMARQIEDSRSDMEGRVAQRTMELKSALEELHETQETLVRREKLVILGQLAGGVGHELRNPLGVMTNAIYYLSVVLKDAPESVREYLSILQTQVGLSEKIVGDLLDFARVKQPKTETVSVLALVEEELTRIGRLDGITVTRDFPPDLPPVCVDRIQMGQVVLNLISNAQQAMDGKGGKQELTLRARADRDGVVTLDVSDTGIGIASEQLTKIFDPLYTTKARGIGLGLSVSRTLAQANGAEIRARSELGVGSTMTIHFGAAGETAA
jgi:signal transduction histidine kinase